MKKVVRDKKVTFKEFCRNRSVDNKDRYTNTKNCAKKVIAKAMKREAEVELEKLEENPKNVYKFLRSLKKEGKDVEGGRCMRGSDGRLYFSEVNKGTIWKEHMESIMNEENN